MSWFSKIFKAKSGGTSTPEEVIHFYKQLGFFSGTDAAAILQQYIDDHAEIPNGHNPWDDVYLLAYDEDLVWADDPEADVCAENKVYSELLPEWARISRGEFTPSDITEHWESESGPTTLRFNISGQPVSVSPTYRDDWIDLEVLQQINQLIVTSGRQFECAVDGNFSLVLCLTTEQKRAMQTQRRFPFAW